jgi:ParB family chromosome partitioning protein
MQAQVRMRAGVKLDPVANLPQGKTRDEVAALAGVSGRTLDKYEAVTKTGTPELLQAVRANEVSVSRAAEIAKLPANEQVEAVKLPRVALNTGNFEWYTPTTIIEAARQAMGSIDTDPASCAQANDTVQASTFYTAEQDGLAQTWAGNVWLNPPYSSPLIGQFVEAVTAKYASGEILQACVITNNCTDTRWAHLLFERAAAVCFTLGRVRFYNAALEEAKKNGPLQGQTIFYFGPRVTEFSAAFTEFGAVLVPVEVAA